MSDATNPTAAGLAHVLTAAGYIAKELADMEAGDQVPDHIRRALNQAERTRDRLIGVLGELRGIDCDFIVIADLLADEPRPHHWTDVHHNIRQATEAVVDLLTTADFGRGLLAEWKPEPVEAVQAEAERTDN